MLCPLGAKPCLRLHRLLRYTKGVLLLLYNIVRYKPAVPWEPDGSGRLLAVMVAAVRAGPRATSLANKRRRQPQHCSCAAYRSARA